MIRTIAVAVGLAFTASTGWSDTYVVNRAADGDCPTFGADLCGPASSDDCTLRCALTLANTHLGPDTLTFDLDPIDECGFTGDPIPCDLAVSTALPAISDDLTIDGASQIGNRGNTNDGWVVRPSEWPLAVGTRGHALQELRTPVVQLRPDYFDPFAATEPSFANGIRAGLEVNPGVALAIDTVAIFGFGDPTDDDDRDANVYASAGSRLTVRAALIGHPALGALTNDGGHRVSSPGSGIIADAAAALTVNASAVLWSSLGGVRADDVMDLRIESTLVGFNGYVFDLAPAGTTATGLTVAGATSGAVITSCVFVTNGRAGLDARDWLGHAAITDSTFLSNNGYDEAGSFGLYLGGNQTLVAYNRFIDHPTSIVVAAATTANRITENAIGATELHIDLLTPSGGAGPTPNADGDGLTDRPVIDAATQVGANLELAGLAPPGAIVEFFIDTIPDLQANGTSTTYIVTRVEGIADTNATAGGFHFQVPLPTGLVRGDRLFATATLGNSTSEYSSPITVTASGALVLSADGPSAVAASSPYFVTVNATVLGAYDALEVDIELDVDEGAIVNATGAGWLCADNTGWRCHATTLTAGVNSTITIVLAAPAAAEDGVHFHASGQTDSLEDGTSAADVSTALFGPDLELTGLTLETDPVEVEHLQTAHVIVTNSGNSQATADLALTLPGPSLIDSVLGANWSCAAAPNLGNELRVECVHGGVLQPGESAPALALAYRAPRASGDYTVVAQVKTTGDVDPTNDRLEIPFHVFASADLGIALTAAPTPAGSDAPVFYTAHVVNLGPDPATELRAVVALPPELPVIQVGGAWSCDHAASVYTCTAALLPAGGSADLTFTVIAPSTPATLVAIATIGTTAPDVRDGVAGNDGMTLETPVALGSDLAVAVVDTPDPAIGGATLGYAVTVQNVGPQPALNMTATLQLAAGADFMSATGAGWSCAFGAGLVSCMGPTLAPAMTTTVTVMTRAPLAAGTATAIATVASGTLDPAPANNIAIVTTAVTAPTQLANLGIGLTPTPEPVDSGGLLSLALAVTNGGPNDAVDATATLTVSSGTLLGASGAGWSCIHGATTATCTRSTVTVGGGATIAVAMTAPDQAGTVAATATIASATPDPQFGNNSAVSSISVVDFADVEVALAAAPNPVKTGAALIYTLNTTNLGPKEARGVSAMIVVGAGAVVGTATGPGWSCTSAGQTATCTRGALAVGPVDPIRLTVTAPASAGELTTTAMLTTASKDPTTGNNLATAKTSVQAQPGCVDDSGCGGATSGRICTSSSCVAGCRGQGGNGCPAGQLCSSITASAGTCMTVVPPDAGVRDAATPDAARDAPANSDAGARDAGARDAPPGADASIRHGVLEGGGGCTMTGRTTDGAIWLFALLLLAGSQRRRRSPRPR